LKIGDVLNSRYRLEKVLGQGGMGEVFLATDQDGERSVAIKAIKPVSPDPNEQQKFLQYFEKEARLLQRLSHPHLVKVFEFFHHSDRACMVMEFVTGDNLFDRLENRSKPFDSKNVLKWTGQLLDVLSYLHGQPNPIIVRDIKPHNIVLNQAGDIRLIDFGIARELKPGKGTSTALKGMGSEGFAPLEQYGHSTTDERSDIYSLGATLYYLLTGIVPPDAVSRATKQAALQDLRSLNPTIEETFATTIHSMLALNPGERPRSVDQIKSLLSAKSTAPLHTLPPAPPPTGRPQSPASSPTTKTSPKPTTSGQNSSFIVIGAFLCIILFIVVSVPKENRRQEAEQTVPPPIEQKHESQPEPEPPPPDLDEGDRAPAQPPEAPSDRDKKEKLYAHALAILAMDRDVDNEIIEVTKQLNDSQISTEEAQMLIEKLKISYEEQVFILNREDYFQARLAFSEVVAERHERILLSDISDPDGALNDPKVRAQIPAVTFSNLFYDLSAAQMERLNLLNEGLEHEIHSGLESARPIYDQQLEFADQYRQARASIDRVLSAPD
jgi:serine/threonine protein kinase